MVAKPLVALLLAVACLSAAACSPVSTQEADRQSPPQGTDQGDLAASPGEGASTVAATPTDAAGQEGATSIASDGSDSSSTDQRGSRIGSDEEPDAPQTAATATVDPGASTNAASTPEPAPVEETATPTPVATTAPVQAPDSPTAEPTPEPTTAPLATPVPVFTTPTPTGPAPSDDIVVQGPDVDESEPVIISERGASACALTESAIEFVDRGDLGRTAAVLQEAAQIAAQATEPEISGAAQQLAAAGADEEAAIAAIIATLNACAVHGYQV